MALEPLDNLEVDEPNAPIVSQERAEDLGISDNSNPDPNSEVRANDGMLGVGASVASLLLILGSVAVGWSFWTEWFAGTDRLLCSIFAALGFFIALSQCYWGKDHPPRLVASSVLWATSTAILSLAVVTGRSKLAGISLGFAVAAWLCYRIRGESIMNAVSLGMVFMIPAFVDACKDRNMFQASVNVAVQIASGLADSVGQSHLLENGGIQFGHGFFDQFACEGRWDSIITYIGISCFCIYAFRRNLVAGVITLSSAFIVWMAVRGTACIAIAKIAAVNGVWPEWTFSTECLLFAIGAIVLLSLDNFFGALLKPIPVEHVNPDFPLFALVWNWMANLPGLTVEVPERLQDTNLLEDFE